MRNVEAPGEKKKLLCFNFLFFFLNSCFHFSSLLGPKNIRNASKNPSERPSDSLFMTFRSKQLPPYRVFDSRKFLTRQRPFVNQSNRLRFTPFEALNSPLILIVINIGVEPNGKCRLAKLPSESHTATKTISVSQDNLSVAICRDHLSHLYL